MNHTPCTACGYVIHHDEECPGCAGEWMDEQICELQTKLVAAQAGIARMNAEWKRDVDDLETKLAAAKAEIERVKAALRAETQDLNNARNALADAETTLTNLRAAAERAQLVLRHSPENDGGAQEAYDVLTPAIEASR